MGGVGDDLHRAPAAAQEVLLGGEAAVVAAVGGAQLVLRGGRLPAAAHLALVCNEGVIKISRNNLFYSSAYTLKNLNRLVSVKARV